MKIRLANREDIKKLKSLDKQWERENISYDVTSYSINEIKKLIRDNAVHVAELNNKIIGFILIKEKIAKHKNNTLKKGQKYINIEALFVSYKYRGKGVASSLIKEVIKNAKKSRCKKIKVAAASYKLEKLIKFYHKNDFTPLYGILVLDL